MPISAWNVDTLGEALVVAASGLVLFAASRHILNVVVRDHGFLTARVLRHARSLDVRAAGHYTRL